MPEEQQEIGRTGTKRVQRLLEATTRFNLPYDAYQHKERVVLPMLTGCVETYDLNGDHLDPDGKALTRIFVESKNLAGAGSQSSEFARFLAQAYSATKTVVDRTGVDPKYEFMWATTCPWIGDGFRQVASEAALRGAVSKEIERDEIVPIGGKRLAKVIPSDHIVDEALLREVRKRVWVWVIADRHEDMSLSWKVRGWVMQMRDEAA